MNNTATKDVLMHHLTAFGDNDLDAIMEDYTADSKLFTPTGPLQGLDNIRQFFADYFTVIPTGSVFEMKQLQIQENIAYIVWSASSALATIPIGTDTFFLENGRIKYHTVADYKMNK